MKLSEVIEKLDLEVVVKGDLSREVTGGYASDLLSNVMARAKEGDLWFTIQGHQNIIAVALLIDVAGIIVAEGFSVDDQTVEKAQEENITLLRSKTPIYELAGRLYGLGIE